MLFCNIISPFPESWRPIYSSHTKAFVIKAMWQKPCHMTSKVKVRKSLAVSGCPIPGRYLPEPSAGWWKAEDTRPGVYVCRLQRTVPAEPSLQEISTQAPDTWGQKPSEDGSAQLFETSSQPFKISQLRPRYQGDASHPCQALSRLFTHRIYEFSKWWFNMTKFEVSIRQQWIPSRVSMALCPWCDGTQKLNEVFVELGWNEIKAPGKTVSIPVRQPSIFRMRYAKGRLTTCQ